MSNADEIIDEDEYVSPQEQASLDAEVFHDEQMKLLQKIFDVLNKGNETDTELANLIKDNTKELHQVFGVLKQGQNPVIKPQVTVNTDHNSVISAFAEIGKSINSRLEKVEDALNTLIAMRSKDIKMTFEKNTITGSIDAVIIKNK